MSSPATHFLGIPRPQLRPLILLSAIAGFLGTLFTFLFIAGVPEIGIGLFIIPASILTWLLLARFVLGKPVWQCILVGALSPLVGALVGLLYVGTGIYWAAIMYRFPQPFILIGISTALCIRILLSPNPPPPPAGPASAPPDHPTHD